LNKVFVFFCLVVHHLFVVVLIEGCLFRRLLSELESEKLLVAGLHCEIDELQQSHASQLEQHSEKARALSRYCI